jgi:hypothetical protein
MKLPAALLRKSIGVIRVDLRGHRLDRLRIARRGYNLRIPPVSAICSTPSGFLLRLQITIRAPGVA